MKLFLYDYHSKPEMLVGYDNREYFKARDNYKDLKQQLVYVSTKSYDDFAPEVVFTVRNYNDYSKAVSILGITDEQQENDWKEILEKLNKDLVEIITEISGIPEIGKFNGISTPNVYLYDLIKKYNVDFSDTINLVKNRINEIKNSNGNVNIINHLQKFIDRLT